MTIALIRHGQTQYNAEGRMQGAVDIPLNDTGRQQARDAAETLRGQGWKVVVSSPMLRARETAQIIADVLELPLGPSYDLLRERRYGEAEGRTMAELEVLWPDRNYPGLESLESLQRRGMAGVQQIADNFYDRSVLAVCHGTLIRYTLGAFAGRQFGPIGNGTVSTLSYADRAWTVHTVGGVDVAELPESPEPTARR